MEGVTLIRLIANNRSRREIGYRRWKFRTARISNEREDSRKSSVRDERWTRWKVSSSGKPSVGYINTCRNPYREGETEEPTLFSLKPKGRDGQETKIQREKSFDASEEEE